MSGNDSVERAYMAAASRYDRRFKDRLESAQRASRRHYFRHGKFLKITQVFDKEQDRWVLEITEEETQPSSTAAQSADRDMIAMNQMLSAQLAGSSIMNTPVPAFPHPVASQATQQPGNSAMLADPSLLYPMWNSRRGLQPFGFAAPSGPQPQDPKQGVNQGSQPNNTPVVSTDPVLLQGPQEEVTKGSQPSDDIAMPAHEPPQSDQLVQYDNDPMMGTEDPLPNIDGRGSSSASSLNTPNRLPPVENFRVYGGDNDWANEVFSTEMGMEDAHGELAFEPVDKFLDLD